VAEDGNNLYIYGISFSVALAADPEPPQHTATFITGEKSSFVRSVARRVSDKQSCSVAGMVFNF